MEAKTTNLPPFKPSKHELARIKEIADSYNYVLNKLERASRFKVGDYLVKYREWRVPGINDEKLNKEIFKNSYGVPHKYVVVHVEGKVPFVQRVSAKGRPNGSIECVVPDLDDDNPGSDYEWQFELDPDFTDALILDSTDNFDPSAVHREKRETFKDVMDHNKANKINCGSFDEILKFMNSLNVGDSYWVSTRTSILVQEKLHIVHGTLPYSKRTNYIGKNVTIPILKCINSKNQPITIYPLDLYRTNVYKTRPRSYKELKDPNL